MLCYLVASRNGLSYPNSFIVLALTVRSVFLSLKIFIHAGTDDVNSLLVASSSSFFDIPIRLEYINCELQKHNVNVDRGTLTSISLNKHATITRAAIWKGLHLLTKCMICFVCYLSSYFIENESTFQSTKLNTKTRWGIYPAIITILSAIVWEHI